MINVLDHNTCNYNSKNQNTHDSQYGLIKNVQVLIYFPHISAQVKKKTKKNATIRHVTVVCERRLVLAAGRINNYLTAFVLH